MKKMRKMADDAKMKKQEEEDEDEDGQEEDEEEEEKSLDLSDADLEKSLELLEQQAIQDDTASRKDTLLSKAQAGDLDDDERQELFEILGGNEPAETLGDEVIKGMKDNDIMQKALDVSDYLDAQHDELVKALGSLGNTIQSTDRRQHDFNLVLAKALVETGKLVKAMSERLGVIADQPAREPMSKGVSRAQPLVKSFAGTPASDELSKGQIMDTMLDMAKSTSHAPCGEDISVAVSKYEQTNMLSKGMLSDVMAHRAKSAA